MTKITRLSPHFALSEFTRSGTADRLGIDNTPNDLVISKLMALCDNVLEPVRVNFQRPISILSGYRCGALNKAVGGAPTSQHTKGEAADIEIAGIPNSEVWRFIVDKLAFDQVIAEKLKKFDAAAGWIHVSYCFGHNRSQSLSFLGHGKYVPGLVYV